MEKNGNQFVIYWALHHGTLASVLNVVIMWHKFDSCGKFFRLVCMVTFLIIIYQITVLTLCKNTSKKLEHCPDIAVSAYGPIWNYFVCNEVVEGGHHDERVSCGTVVPDLPSPSLNPGG